MSFGDELMAGGQAYAHWERTNRPVMIVDRNHRGRWHEVWRGNPAVLHPSQHRRMRGRYDTIQNGVQCRPYIRYPFSRETGCAYSGWRARDHWPRLFLDPDEIPPILADMPPFVVIEPHVPAQSNPNKRYPWQKWQGVVDELRGLHVVQVGPVGTETLRGVPLMVTDSFRAGCAVLSRARAYLGVEGGLHHAAAALNVPGVVLFGGSPSPEVTGYPLHSNFAAATTCGKWMPCDHCMQYWSDLEPSVVAGALKEVLRGHRRRSPASHL